LHAKEEAIVEKMEEIIDEAEEDDENYDFGKWEGTNGD
tara:strand:- start:225 stop:338 length:114 start_codon:yes stop_codon:yes gene_type:complete